MFCLLLLVLVGTLYAQEPGEPLHNEVDEQADPNIQEEEDFISDDLNEFELEEESGDLLHNDTNELDDPAWEDNEDDLFDYLEANQDDPDLEEQPEATLEIKEENGRSRRLKYYRRPRTFAGAENACEKHDGDLSSVHSRRINARMRRMMKGNRRNTRNRRRHSWIGAWKPWRLGNYQNVDQTPMDYNRFEQGERKKTGRWCVAMNILNGRWSSQNCRRKLPFVCKT